MDGFEISATQLYDYDMNRIESITILKDAAATAQYGSRAANGVVLITTKQPKEGQLRVNYTFNSSISTPDLSSYNLTNAQEKLYIEERAGIFTPTASNEISSFASEYQAKMANIKAGIDTDWLSIPVQTALNHKHSLYIEGGTGNIRYGVDLGYDSNSGTMIGSYRDRISAGVNLQYTYKNLSIRNKVSFNATMSEDSPYGSFDTYARMLPYDSPYNADGSVAKALRDWPDANGDYDIANPLYESTLGSFSKSNSDDITNNLDINWRFKNDFLFMAQFSISRSVSSSEDFTDPESLYNTYPLSNTNLVSGELYTNSSDNLSYNLRTTLSYNKYIKDNSINFTVGFEALQNSSNSLSTQYRGFPLGGFSSPAYAREVVDGYPLHSDGISRTMGAISTLNYTFKDIYLADASLRIDGSSQFGANKRYAPFWSFGAGINIHNYEFWEKDGIVNSLKLRASYGETGNASFSPYESFMTYDIETDIWYKTGMGANLVAYGNANLLWETTRTLDVGFETNLFKNSLFIKASYYDKQTYDMITNKTIPSSSGFNTVKENLGEVSNKGFELSVRANIYKRNNLYINVYGNLAQNINRIGEISSSLEDYNKQVQDMFDEVTVGTGAYTYAGELADSKYTQPLPQFVEGGSIYSIWAVQSVGVDPVTGKEIYLGRDGSYTDVYSAADQVVVGSTEPIANGSFGVSATYKNLSLYASFSYSIGADVYNSTLANKVEGADLYESNVDRRVLDSRWMQVGDVAQYQGQQGRAGFVNLIRPTSRFVMEENRLTGSSIEVSYDLSSMRFVKRMKLSVLRLSLGTNDIFYLSTIPQERGTSYPYAKTYNFTLRASF